MTDGLSETFNIGNGEKVSFFPDLWNINHMTWAVWGRRTLAIILSCALISQRGKQVRKSVLLSSQWLNDSTENLVFIAALTLVGIWVGARQPSWGFVFDVIRALLNRALMPLSSQCVSGIPNIAHCALFSGERVWDETEGEEAWRSVWWAEDFLGDASGTSECWLADWRARREGGSWSRRERQG